MFRTIALLNLNMFINLLLPRNALISFNLGMLLMKQDSFDTGEFNYYFCKSFADIYSPGIWARSAARLLPHLQQLFHLPHHLPLSSAWCFIDLCSWPGQKAKGKYTHSEDNSTSNRPPGRRRSWGGTQQCSSSQSTWKRWRGWTGSWNKMEYWQFWPGGAWLEVGRL